MVLEKLTVMVAGIVITGWVARLVRYNYRATRIVLVGEEDKDSGHARKEERKEGRRFLAPGMSSGHSRGVNNFNPIDEIVFNSLSRFDGEVCVLPRGVNPKSRFSLGVYRG